MSQMATMPTNPIIVIPARLASTRLPGKPLADIDGEPMIVHVWRRAIEAEIGPVVVACAEAEIADAVTKAGGEAVLTEPDLPSGSDRIFEALQSVDPERRHDARGQRPGRPADDSAGGDPRRLCACWKPRASISAPWRSRSPTPASAATPTWSRRWSRSAPGARVGRALYFTRATAPTGEAPLWHHIGIYAYRRDGAGALRLAAASALEQRERLEQLRALEQACASTWRVVDAVPLGVDTPADLARARVMLGR